MAEEEQPILAALSAVSGALKEPDNTFGRCVHNTAEALDMEYQEYLWAKDAKITKEELTEAMDNWGLESPNLVLTIIGPASSNILYKEALKSPELKTTVKELIACRTMSKTGVYEEPPDDYDIMQDDGLFKLVTEKLTENIIQMLISLLSACEQTNSWIQVNYNGHNYTDWLIEQALMRCEARPVIIALIGRDYYTGQEKAWATLEKGARDLRGKAKVSDLPIVRVPVVKPSKADNSWPVGYATHYFFMHPDEDGNWFPFPVEWLGPAGTMFVSGGPVCAQIMNDSVRSLRPTILMKHSGKACDFFSFAVEAVAEGKHTSPDMAMKAMTEAHPIWYNREGWTDGGGFLYGEIHSDKAPRYMSSIFGAYQRNPERFKSSIVVLDAWQTKPETALRRLSACFAATSTVAVSGLDAGGSEAQEETLETAWNLHDVLAKNCRTVAWKVNVLSVAAVALSMITTTLSVSITYLETLDPNDHSEWSRVLMDTSNMMMILLPAVGGLMLQILSRFHYMNKWGAMHMARQQIASEIFKYRATAGEYDETANVLKSTMLKNEDGKSSGKSLHRARDIFTARVSELFGTVFSHALVDDSIHFDSDIYEKSKNPAEMTWEELAKPLLSDGAAAAVEAVVPVAKVQKTRTPDDGVVSSKDDDGYTHLGGEEYFEHRTLPLLRKLQAEGPMLSWRLQMYELAILILSLMSTLLAALDMKLWIPITIAFGTGLTSYMNYEALQSRLSAANTSIAELTRLVGHWASLGVVEKRTRSVKTLLVEVTENAVLRHSTAYIAGIAQASYQEKGSAEGPESKDGKGAGDGKGGKGSEKEGAKKTK